VIGVMEVVSAFGIRSTSKKLTESLTPPAQPVA
jgi:hypothetical protein